MQKFLIFIAVCSMLFANFVFAVGRFEPSDLSYLIHIYYDGKKFVPNTNSKFQYDILAESFEQASVEVPYVGEVISVKGETLASFFFDPKYVGAKVARGPLDVKAPYFANAKSVKLYDDSGNLLIQVNVSDTVACNENGICEKDAGEDYSFCPSDCKAEIPITPVVSAVPLPSAGGNGNAIVWIILGGGTLIAAIVWLVMRRRRKQLDQTMNPPENMTQ